MTSLLPHIAIETGPRPVAAVIWLHGLGADGHDFAAIVPQLDLRQCPPIRFVFPHAPSRPVTLNGGYVMPAWYDILGPSPARQEDASGIQQSARAIAALIEAEVARGVDTRNIVLAGFSQGCAMALHTGLRFEKSLAGIIALSGYLPLTNTVAAERHPANQHTPIFMAHGTQDPVVLPARGLASRDQLEALDQPVQWHSYPMPHSVHPDELADISAFLSQVLNPDPRTR